ncbi:MAG: hypothetical protein AB8E82_01420 [Aureispira sp.]
MKNGLNKKIFNDKVLLQKNLPKYLKKTTLALASKKVSSLPFYYEVAHFEDGAAFITIGEAKEVHRIFKTERVKGNGGKDEQGKIIKINKKLVAYGDLCLNEEGVYEFQIQAGFIKKQQLKACINSITVLKQTIGQNFAITKGGVPVKEEESVDSKESVEEKTVHSTSNTEESTNTQESSKQTTTQQDNSKKEPSKQWLAQKATIKTTLGKMKTNLENLKAKFN